MHFQQEKWSLSDLYNSQDSGEMRDAFDELAGLVDEFESNRSKLQEDISPDEFIGILCQLEAITNLLYRIYDFGALQFAEDTQNQKAQVFQAKVDQLIADVQNRTLFFNLWWKEMEESHAERYMAVAGDYRYWLEEMRHFKPHTLSEGEEKIINIKDTTGSRALTTLYDSITNRYAFTLTIDGEKEVLTRGQLMVYVRDHDPDTRKNAYQELYRVYGQDGPVLGQMYQTLVRDWRNEKIDLRRFSSPIAARNLANDIPDEAVVTLLGVCERNAHIFQRFFRLKASLLGMDRLRRYDIYAPVSSSSKTYAFNEAADSVFEALSAFDPKLAKMARRVLEQKHLDSEIRKGKRDGAFCATVTPDLTPWVLVNYQGRPEDAATLAHELGHAIHSMLAEHHNVFTQQPSLPLAETASTFSEMLLVDHLLEQENDQSLRRDLLFRQVDDAYATILRQAFFAIFERTAHQMIHQDASVDDLAQAYMLNLGDQFGKAVELSDEFRWEWVSIPHIYHVPFYVYAYSFGQLLVLSLYQQYKADGDEFKPRYLEILSAGGSDAPVNILSRAGIDIYQDDFWQGGFNVLQNIVEQLELLPG
jgi:oligoendopeptidase F